MLNLIRSVLRRVSIIWRRYGSKRTTAELQVWRRRLATAVGAILLGLAALAFASVSDTAQHAFLSVAHDYPYAPLLITPAVFVIGTLFTLRWLAETRGSGIPQVIAACRDPQDELLQPLVSLRTALGKFVLTVFVLLGGGSFGREGPTVQIGAAIMVAMHRLLRVPLTPGVLIAGGAAGVAAAFNTPLAGVAVAIEELPAAYEQRVAILVMGAVMVAGLVSLGVAGDYVYFGVMHDTLSVESALVIAPVLGVVCGVAGGLFSRLVLGATNSSASWFSMLRRRPLLTAAGCGLIVAVLGVASGGETFGTGYEMSRRLVEGDAAPMWLAPAKFLATLASTFSGNAGGIFAPSLSVGASLGHLISTAFPAEPSSAIVVLGMAAYFTGVVRAPFTAVIIVSEATAGRGMILPLFAAALIADGASTIVCKTRLYHGLARPFLSHAGPPPA